MTSNARIAFGEFQLDDVNECLWRGAQAIALRPKPFAVLKFLVERPGQLVTKQQILDAVWPDTFVTDAVLKDSISQLREALADEAKSPQYIETAHRRGYRFIGDMRGDEQSSNKPQLAAPIGVEPPPRRLSPFPTLFELLSSPTSVVGRGGDLSQMSDWLASALCGDRQIVFVTGEAGIGKTTIVEAFMQEIVAGTEIRVGRGQCLEQYGEGEAYLPVLEAISRMCRESERGSIVELLKQHAPTWLAQMPALVSPAEREALRQQTQGASRERMLREMAETIEALAAETPIVILLEDLHWSDFSTLDLISYLARRRESARLMLIGTYRPVEVILSEHPLKGVKQDLQMHRLCQELPLEYLTEEAVGEYLTARFPQHKLPDGLTKLIHQRTEGNPLFMSNVVDYLLHEKIIAERDGCWYLQVALTEVELGVPENIRYLIEKQVERLPPDEQRVLEGASVVGLSCSAVAIAEGLAADVVEVEECCEKLARHHQFLAPPQLVTLPDGTITPRFKFIHILYLEVLYGRIGVTRRAQIHSRIGASGERIYGEHVVEIAAELAVHFEQGRDWVRAIKYLQIAADNAARCFAYHEAITLARRGLELLPRMPKASARQAQETTFHAILNSASQL